MDTAITLRDIPSPMTELDLDIEVTSAQTVHAMEEVHTPCNTLPSSSMTFPRIESKAEVLSRLSRMYHITDPRDVYRTLTVMWHQLITNAQRHTHKIRVAMDDDSLTPNVMNYHMQHVRDYRARAANLLNIRREFVWDTIYAGRNLEAFLATGALIATCRRCKQTMHSGDFHLCEERP